MGLPGKPKGFDEGKIKEIAEYCETDVVGTYQVWLRYELFCGRLTQKCVRSQPAQFSGLHECAFEHQGAPVRHVPRQPPTVDQDRSCANASRRAVNRTPLLLNA